MNFGRISQQQLGGLKRDGGITKILIIHGDKLREKSVGPGGLSSESWTSHSVMHSLYDLEPHWSLWTLGYLLEPSSIPGSPPDSSVNKPTWFSRGRGKGNRSLRWGNWEQTAKARKAWNLVLKRTHATPPLGHSLLSLLVTSHHTPQGQGRSKAKIPLRKSQAVPGAQSAHSLEKPSCLRKKQRSWLGFP